MEREGFPPEAKVILIVFGSVALERAEGSRAHKSGKTPAGKGGQPHLPSKSGLGLDIKFDI